MFKEFFERVSFSIAVIGILVLLHCTIHFLCAKHPHPIFNHGIFIYLCGSLIVFLGALTIIMILLVPFLKALRLTEVNILLRSEMATALLVVWLILFSLALEQRIQVSLPLSTQLITGIMYFTVGFWLLIETCDNGISSSRKE